MDSMDLIAFSIKDMQATYKKWSNENSNMFDLEIVNDIIAELKDDKK